MARRYRITNYGNTRKFPYKGEYYEISKNSSIETNNKQLAEEFGTFLFVDVKTIEQPMVKAKPSKRKKKVTSKIHKKIKRRKVKRRTK